MFARVRSKEISISGFDVGCGSCSSAITPLASGGHPMSMSKHKGESADDRGAEAVGEAVRHTRRFAEPFVDAGPNCPTG